MSSTSGARYRVFVNAYVGAPRNHHGILVELEEDGSGYLYHVEGSVQTGMRYNPKPARSPLESPSLLAQKPIGWVPASLYGQIHTICSSIPPPPKQYDGPKLLVPKSQLRRCQEWTNEAIVALRAHGVLQGSESAWMPRADLERQGERRSESPKGKSKASSSVSKSKSSASSKSSTSSTHPISRSSISSSSTSEPADGAVSADGYWVYSKQAKDWYHLGQDGKVTWAKQGKGKAH